ncbi:hypothetical protein NN561_001709 [Cricetulus griseus]
MAPSLPTEAPLAKLESRDRTEQPERAQWISGRLGGRGPRTPSAPSQAARGRRQEGCCAAAHLREPPARSHPPRAPELGRVRPVRRGAVAKSCAGRGRPPPGSRPNGVTCAGSRDESRGRRLRGAGRAQRGSQAPGHPARPEGCAGRSHARDARGSRGRLKEQPPRLAPPLPPRPPGLRARVTAERLLKGAAAARTRLALAAAPTPGRSGRGPEAARGAHLPALELKCRRGLGAASFGGGQPGDSESSPSARVQ